MFPANAAVIVPTASDDWIMDVANHPADIALIGFTEFDKITSMFLDKKKEAFFINSIEKIKR